MQKLFSGRDLKNQSRTHMTTPEPSNRLVTNPHAPNFFDEKSFASFFTTNSCTKSRIRRRHRSRYHQGTLMAHVAGLKGASASNCRSVWLPLSSASNCRCRSVWLPLASASNCLVPQRRSVWLPLTSASNCRSVWLPLSSASNCRVLGVTGVSALFLPIFTDPQ